jgi:lysophospholipase L1-like esterase
MCVSFHVSKPGVIVKGAALAAFAWLLTSCPPVQTLNPEEGKPPFQVMETGGAANPEDADDLRVPSISLKDAGETDGKGASEEALLQSINFGKKVPLDPEPLTEFFEALDQTRDSASRRLVRILHFGDSHSAADVLPSEIRRALQSRFGNGGRGFVLLGKPWRSYSPLDVEIDAQGNWVQQRIFASKDPAEMDGLYGLCGVAVDSPDKGGRAAVMSSQRTDYCNKVSAFELSYLKKPEGGKFIVRVDGKREAVIDTDAGEISSGFYRVDLKEGRHRLEVLVHSKEKIRLFGAVLESSGPGVVYDTLGVNGARFYTSLRWDETLLAEQIARRTPDLIITMYGANEAEVKHFVADRYKEQVRRAMERLMSPAKDASCLILGPTDRLAPKLMQEEEPALRVDKIINVQREVADEMGCAFIDLKEMIGGRDSHVRWQDQGLAAADGVHLTTNGYELLGRLIAERILVAYDQYRQTEFGENTDSDNGSNGVK